jgi:hypothetical protein
MIFKGLLGFFFLPSQVLYRRPGYSVGILRVWTEIREADADNPIPRIAPRGNRCEDLNTTAIRYNYR